MAIAPTETRIELSCSNPPRISPSSRGLRDSKTSTKDAPLLRFPSFSSTKLRRKRRSCLSRLFPVSSPMHHQHYSRNNSTLAIACHTRSVTIRSHSRRNWISAIRASDSTSRKTPLNFLCSLSNTSRRLEWTRASGTRTRKRRETCSILREWSTPSRLVVLSSLLVLLPWWWWWSSSSPFDQSFSSTTSSSVCFFKTKRREEEEEDPFFLCRFFLFRLLFCCLCSSPPPSSLCFFFFFSSLGFSLGSTFSGFCFRKMKERRQTDRQTDRHLADKKKVLFAALLLSLLKRWWWVRAGASMEFEQPQRWWRRRATNSILCKRIASPTNDDDDDDDDNDKVLGKRPLRWVWAF